jgi:RNA polymerase sigma-70 factor, ECF subfamily
LNLEKEIEQALVGLYEREKIIEMVMDEYGTKLKRMIYSYVKDWEVASDITQEVFITVYEKLLSFNQRSSFKTWLYTIAINKSKDYLKSWHYRNLVINEKLFFFKQSNEKSPESIMIEEDERGELAKAIMALPVKYREVFLLHYYQGFTYTEISEALQLPIATVRTRLFRGKERCKQYLLKERGEQHG